MTLNYDFKDEKSEQRLAVVFKIKNLLNSKYASIEDFYSKNPNLQVFVLNHMKTQLTHFGHNEPPLNEEDYVNIINDLMQNFKTNTGNMLKEPKKNQEGLKLFPLTEINRDLLNEAQKELYDSAMRLQLYYYTPLKIDFKNGAVVDQNGNIIDQTPKEISINNQKVLKPNLDIKYNS